MIFVEVVNAIRTLFSFAGFILAQIVFVTNQLQKKAVIW